MIVCTAQDVTGERTEAADKTTSFGRLVGASDDFAFYTLDHEGYIMRWNQGAERLKGYEASEIFGEHMSKFFTDENREGAIPEQLIEAAEKEGTGTEEGWRIRKDGSEFWAEATISASYDDTGTIRGFGKMTRIAST